MPIATPSYKKRVANIHHFTVIITAYYLSTSLPVYYYRDSATRWNAAINWERPPWWTFNDVGLVFNLVVFIVDSLLHRLVVVDDVLSHTQVVTDDCLCPVVHQRTSQQLSTHLVVTDCGISDTIYHD